MPEQPSAAQSRAPVITGVGLTAIVAAAVIAVSPFNKASEGERYNAYLDPAKIPTICRGHTKGVKLGDIATPAQCEAFYRADMTEHMLAALKVTPALAQKPAALQAAGDFTFNAGPAWWAKSPMAAHFAKGEWSAGCEAFVGYLTLYKAPAPVKGGNCRLNSKGVLYCEAGGLVTRRKKERAICLGLPV